MTLDSDSLSSIPIYSVTFFFTLICFGPQLWNKAKIDPKSLDCLRINDAININLCHSASLIGNAQIKLGNAVFCGCCFYYNHFYMPSEASKKHWFINMYKNRGFLRLCFDTKHCLTSSS